MKSKWWIAIPVVVFCYLSAPYFAGALKIGERRGPIIYPRQLHAALYITGCEEFHGYKPRDRPGTLFYRRAYFYGFAERPHPREKRLQQLEKIRKSPLPVDFLNQLTEIELRIAEEEKTSTSK
ncbi:MAG: hypothetical protein K0R17_3151 [Rariglobus sp.]|jgi:hypothetical protein|nr:hypothetical protein [Rariglobus sp.]